CSYRVNVLFETLPSAQSRNQRSANAATLSALGSTWVPVARLARSLAASACAWALVPRRVTERRSRSPGRPRGRSYLSRQEVLPRRVREPFMGRTRWGQADVQARPTP